MDDKLIRGGLVRCDFAMNYIKKEHLGEDTLRVYSSKEKKLRDWEENLGEGFVGMVVEGKLRTGQQKVEEIEEPYDSRAHKEFFSIYSDEEEVDRMMDKEEIEVNQDDVEEETLSDESDDWAVEVDCYDLPAKFGFK